LTSFAHSKIVYRFNKKISISMKPMQQQSGIVFAALQLLLRNTPNSIIPLVIVEFDKLVKWKRSHKVLKFETLKILNQKFFFLALFLE